LRMAAERACLVSFFIFGIIFPNFDYGKFSLLERCGPERDTGDAKGFLPEDGPRQPSLGYRPIGFKTLGMRANEPSSD
jgi:hypothetical protein